jgi:hypothetical protein
MSEGAGATLAQKCETRVEVSDTKERERMKSSELQKNKNHHLTLIILFV